MPQIDVQVIAFVVFLNRRHSVSLRVWWIILSIIWHLIPESLVTSALEPSLTPLNDIDDPFVIVHDEHEVSESCNGVEGESVHEVIMAWCVRRRKDTQVVVERCLEIRNAVDDAVSRYEEGRCFREDEDVVRA